MTGLGDFSSLLKQAQKMQKEMGRIKSELRERVVEGSSGGGMVKVHVNGLQEVLSVKIDPSVVDADDVEMLEDLVMAALKQGLKAAKELSESEMAKLTGGIHLPGLF